MGSERSRCRLRQLESLSREGDASRYAAAAKLHPPLEERDPHVGLDLLRHPQAVVEEIHQRTPAACPGLDLEYDLGLVRACSELNLPGLEVPGERSEAERTSAHVDHPDGAVPRARH